MRKPPSGPGDGAFYIIKGTPVSRQDPLWIEGLDQIQGFFLLIKAGQVLQRIKQHPKTVFPQSVCTDEDALMGGK